MVILRFSEWVTREYVQGLAERRDGGGLLEAADRFYDAQLLSEADIALRRAAEIFEDLGDRRGVAITLHQLAMIAQDRGDYDEAERLYRQSLKRKGDLGDRRGAATTKAALAILMEGRGNLSEAAALMTEALETFKSMGDPRASRAASDFLRILKKMGRSEGDSEAL
ncbi:MAG: tetratricopeptide repeat protein [Candidatus Korarchaeota archaeon]|nr:tetratricopeptide repeat protein [Candidatus Korarchaeota archaeon]